MPRRRDVRSGGALLRRLRLIPNRGHYVDGYNVYQYVGSRPLEFTDPSGLRIVKCRNTQLAADDLPGGFRFIWAPDSYGPDPCWQLGTEWVQCMPTPDEGTAIVYCLGDSVCQQELTQLLNLIYQGWYSFFVGDQVILFGRYDTCTTWVIKYMKIKIGKIGACKKLRVCQKDWTYTGGFWFWDHHSTVEICFPSGDCILLDQGWWGGRDHIYIGDPPGDYVAQ